MIPKPQLRLYANASSEQRRAIQNELVSWWFSRLSNVGSFDALSLQAKGIANELSTDGWEVRLLDEDAESLVVFGVRLTAADAVTISSTWDDDEGPSVACRFTGTQATVCLAKAVTGGIVETG